MTADAHDVVEAVYADPAARDKDVYDHLKSLLGLPQEVLHLTDVKHTCFTLCNERLVAHCYVGPFDAGKDDFVYWLPSHNCPLCLRAGWKSNLSRVYDAIVSAATHLRRNPRGRVRIQNGAYCTWGCSKVAVVLVSVYLDVGSGPSRQFASSSSPPQLVTPQILDGALSYLDWTDRRVAARVCRDWHRAVHDPARSPSTTGDALDLLRRRFARLDGHFWTAYPSGAALVVALALTRHWLRGR
jgi:hypothetical protein